MRTPEQRLEDCKEVLEYFKNPENANTGICIKLGDIVYGNYMDDDCPWVGWDTLAEYYPEICSQDNPQLLYENNTDLSSKEMSSLLRGRRIEILKEAIHRLKCQLTPLTLRHRLDAYNYALDQIDTPFTKICHLLKEYTTIISPAMSYMDWFYIEVDLNYPELFAQKPKDVSVLSIWWPLNEEGLSKRKSALEAAIKLTKIYG